MKRLKMLSGLLSVLFLCLIYTTGAFAANTTREYFFELTVDGSDTKQVQPGDVITVVFNLERTDSDESYDMYAMQNEIRYDSNFFELVEGSALLSSGIATTDIGLRDNFREFYMNSVSLAGGEEWEAHRLIGSFQLRVIADSGVTKITNQDYMVSTSDGKDHYKASCQDVTIILTTDCTVQFITNGGNDIPSQTVMYGELIECPEDPVREGYQFVGWYSDIDLKNYWDFDTDTVEGNTTLYAKWQKESTEPVVAPDVEETPKSGAGILLLVGLGILFLILILVLLLGRRTVRFVTDTDEQIKSQTIRKGGYVDRPEEPKRQGRIFAGWYTDEDRTRRWDFENDTVKDNMTLYAKWI